MDGRLVVDALKKHGASSIFHANSLATSLSFFEVGGLASRAYLEGKGLGQTEQKTDAIDKKYGVWDSIFLDTVDIHKHIGRRNLYGPVLFVFDVNALCDVSDPAEVLITRKNPCYWKDGEMPVDRYFLSEECIQTQVRVGDFGHIITTHGFNLLPFASGLKKVILDFPGGSLTREASDLLNKAREKIENRLEELNFSVIFQLRRCLNCDCWENYNSLWGNTRLLLS